MLAVAPHDAAQSISCLTAIGTQGYCFHRPRGRGVKIGKWGHLLRQGSYYRFHGSYQNDLFSELNILITMYQND